MTDNSFECHPASNADIARCLQEVLADDRSWLFATVDHVGSSLVAHCLAGMSREAVMRTAAFRLTGCSFTAIEKRDLPIGRVNKILEGLGLDPGHSRADGQRDVLAVCSEDSAPQMRLVLRMLRDLSAHGMAARHRN